MFNIGDKVAALIRDNTTGSRIQVPQIILSDTKQVRIESNRINQLTGRPVVFVNTVATVIAKHPVSGALYIRPEETLNWHIPRFNQVEGLDVLNGRPLSLEALMGIYTEEQTKRLEAYDNAEVEVPDLGTLATD